MPAGCRLKDETTQSRCGRRGSRFQLTTTTCRKGQHESVAHFYLLVRVESLTIITSGIHPTRQFAETAMLVNKIICAHCKTALKSAAGVPEGTVIPCPKCKKKFKVEAPDDDEIVEDFEVMDDEGEEEEEDAPKKKPAPKPAEKNAFASLGVDEKLKKKKPPRDDDNKPKKKAQSKDEDDDDDDRPRKKKKKKKKKSAYAELKENIWVRASVLGVLLLGLGIAIWIRVGRTTPPDTTETIIEKNEDDDKPAPQRPKKAANKRDEELEKFRGTWNAVAATVAGMRVPNAVLDKYSFTWNGETVVSAADPNTTLRCLLNFNKKPAEIDLKRDGTESDYGIYQFNQDGTLDLCFVPNGAPAFRPSEFKSPAESSILLLKLRRDSSAAPPQSTPAVKNILSRTDQLNRLKQLGVAMHNHCDTAGHFPDPICDPNGKMLLSWRVAILPHIEEGALFNEFKLDEPWDSEHNKKLIPRMPKVFRTCNTEGLTHFRVMYGQNVVLGVNNKTQLQGITDGSSNTIVVFEAGDATTWTKPEEAEFDESKPLPKLGSANPTSFAALFADGSVRFIPTSTAENTLRLLFQKNDGQVVEIPN